MDSIFKGLDLPSLLTNVIGKNYDFAGGIGEWLTNSATKKTSGYGIESPFQQTLQSDTHAPMFEQLTGPIVQGNAATGNIITDAVSKVSESVSSGFQGVFSFFPMLLQTITTSSMMSGLSGMVGGTSGSGGIMGFLGDLVVGVMGAKDGAAFHHGIKAFAKGGLVNAPTLFAMANGGVGLMGEAGPEAVMPLVRGANGKLGVANHGGSGGNQSVFNINITGDVSRQTRSEIQRMIPQIAGGVNQHNYEKGVR